MGRRRTVDRRSSVMRAVGRRRRVMGAVAAAAVITCLAGCASVAVRTAAAGGPSRGRPARTHHARSSPAPPVPAPGTTAEAGAEARHLLAGLVLPGGARRLPQRPVPGAVSTPGQNLGTGLDVYRLFSLPVSMGAAQQFVQAHLPAGLTPGGTGSGGDGDGPQYYEVTADVAPSAVPAGIYTAQLVYTIAPDPDGGSLLRADAQIIIYPARSAAEYLDPADIRSVTVSHTAPDPVSRTITSRPEIARLARLVDSEHAFPLGLVFSCPAEFPPSYQLTFTPVSASRPTVVVDPANCLSDGVLTGGVRQPALLDAGLLSVTERLLPRPKRAQP
ncbi:MAG TPA: hypothetical protein VMC83_32655 [Streptosporangiaceae bacterium]|nr:hypothetical protein [Streptosporangiaceae bacterium]